MPLIYTENTVSLKGILSKTFQNLFNRTMSYKFLPITISFFLIKTIICFFITSQTAFVSVLLSLMSANDLRPLYMLCRYSLTYIVINLHSIKGQLNTNEL